MGSAAAASWLRPVPDTIGMGVAIIKCNHQPDCALYKGAQFIASMGRARGDSQPRQPSPTSTSLIPAAGFARRTPI